MANQTVGRRIPGSGARVSPRLGKQEATGQQGNAQGKRGWGAARGESKGLKSRQSGPQEEPRLLCVLPSPELEEMTYSGRLKPAAKHPQLKILTSP